MYDPEFLAQHREPMPEETPERDTEQTRQWEENHQVIMKYIKEYMRDERKVPTIMNISKKTNLTRATIYKHLQGFSADPEFAAHTSMFKIMVTDVLRQLYIQTTYGEVKAARLYMEIMGVLKTGKTVNNSFINNQHNHLKINNILLTEEVLQSLNTEQLQQIEGILLKNLPKEAS